MAGSHVRRTILARRAKFISAALAGATLSAGACESAQTIPGHPLEGGGGSTSSDPTGPSTMPMTCLTTTWPPTDCAALPTYLECANCFCQEDLAGCGEYVRGLFEYVYCGMTCALDCEAFCATVEAGDPDSGLLMQGDPCMVCVESMPPDHPDVEAFDTHCMQDADCSDFLAALSTCTPEGAGGMGGAAAGGSAGQGGTGGS